MSDSIIFKVFFITIKVHYIMLTFVLSVLILFISTFMCFYLVCIFCLFILVLKVLLKQFNF